MINPETNAGNTESSIEAVPVEAAAFEERRKLRIKEFISLLTDQSLDSRWKATEALGVEGDSLAVQPLWMHSKTLMSMSSG